MQTGTTIELQKAQSSYQDQWESLRSKHPSLETLLNLINSKKGHALIFGHDDADGVTSGLIFKRMLEKKGWQASVLFPERFTLSQEQMDQALRQHAKADAVFIVDKGTLPEYSAFGKQMPLYIVDHHPCSSPPTDCVYFNPALEKYLPCSASILCHGIATLAGTRDEFDDFLSLVGMKADWVIEPVTGILPDFAKPFCSEYGSKFKNLLEITSDKPTIYEVEQREKTCLLNRISEFVQATTGSGFQYFYHDRDASLKNVNHQHCTADALEKMAPRIEQIKKIGKFDEFLRMLPEPEGSVLKKIFSFFIEDWENAENLLDSTAKIARFADTAVYFFTGGKVPLLPMVGSVKLLQLKQNAGDKFAMILMVSSVSPSYTHVSVRATGDQVHSGKFCNQLALRLQKKFPQWEKQISGGGHPRAAECTAHTPDVSFSDVLIEILSQINEMKVLDKKLSSSKPSESEQKTAKELGLDYLIPS